MSQKALLQRCGEIIEEEVQMRINDIELVGFANVVPYQIIVGGEYETIIEITVFDEFNITELQSNTKEFERIGDSFKYLIRGKLLERGVLDAGIIIKDELLEEYDYLVGKYIEIRVDRINIEFI